jgi:uncharacterized protein YdaU (DUF1376 family)
VESQTPELLKWRIPMPKKKKQPKNKPPAFQFYAKDWTASPTRQMMSLAAQGAYINLLAIAWDSDPIATIPNQPDKLWKLADAMPEEWKVIRDEVLENFEPFDEDPTRLVNKRLRRQWLELKEFSAMASDRGKKGAAGRWPNEPDGGVEEDDETPEEDQTEEEVAIDEDAV